MHSPSKINEVLQSGSIAALKGLVKEVFGFEFNTKCSICINDAKVALMNYVSNKEKNSMANFAWIGNKTAQVVINVGGSVKLVTAQNCTEADANVIASIPKYSHLVEVKAPIAVDLLEEVNLEESPNELEATTSTSTDVLTVAPTVKKKKGRPFSKSKE